MLVVSGGRRIEMGCGFDAGTLRRLMPELEQASDQPRERRQPERGSPPGVLDGRMKRLSTITGSFQYDSLGCATDSANPENANLLAVAFTVHGASRVLRYAITLRLQADLDPHEGTNPRQTRK